MFKLILATLLLAFTFGALCPEPAAASATGTNRTDSSYGHRRRYRRRRGTRIILRFPGYSI
jgi:hypothetical protein